MMFSFQLFFFIEYSFILFCICLISIIYCLLAMRCWFTYLNFETKVNRCCRYCLALWSHKSLALHCAHTYFRIVSLSIEEKKKILLFFLFSIFQCICCIYKKKTFAKMVVQRYAGGHMFKRSKLLLAMNIASHTFIKPISDLSKCRRILPQTTDK